jgi:hypothetical protein
VVAAELAAPAAALAGAESACTGSAPTGSAGSRGARWWLIATVGSTIGAAVTAITLAPSGSAHAPEALAFLLFVGSSVHVASTGWFYTVPEVRAYMRSRPARYIWWPLALITGAGAIAVLVPAAALNWLLLPYFGWQFFHYQKQNLGVAALAAVATHVGPLRAGERRALTGAGLAAAAALMSRPSLLQLPIRPVLPPGVPLLLFPVAAVAFAASVGVGVYFLARRAVRPPGFCAAYLTSLVFGLPVFVFTSPYAAVAGLTIGHGLQYLLLMGMVAAGGAGSGRGEGRILQLAVLCNVALLGGALLSVASDQAAAGRPVLFGVFLGAVMAHFVIDAGLWRLRDEFPRGFLASRLPYLVTGAR